MTRKPTQRPGGFTLVELLVVIGIIALLISILLPSLASARRSANNVKCLSNQRQLGLGVVQFTQDHDGWILKGWFNDYPRPAGEAAFRGGGGSGTDFGFLPDLWGWDYVLKSTYVNDDEVFRCPSDDTDFRRGTWNDAPGYNWPPSLKGAKANPDDPKVDNIPASYSYNSSNCRFLNQAIKLTDLSNASNAIMISDARAKGVHHISTSDTGYGGDCFIGPTPEQKPDQLKNAAPYRHTVEGRALRGSGPTATPIFRVNAVFADGHAEGLAWDKTFEMIGGPVQFHKDVPGQPDNTRGPLVVGVPTMWRQVFEDGAPTDKYDNPNTDADDANPR